MTPDEIRSHALFGKLTEKQKVFVNELMVNGNDKIDAASKAWACKNEESARTQANRALKHEGIAFLVEQYFGKDPTRERFTKEGALEFASSKARMTEDPKIALDYLRLVVQMEGWLVKPADNELPKTPNDGNAEFTL
jgi:hypothetical protein